MCPYSPESNGKAERLNWSLNNISRTILLGLRLVKTHERLSKDEAQTANYLRNRMFPLASNNADKTRYEVIMAEKRDFKHIRRFRCEAYMH